MTDTNHTVITAPDPETVYQKAKEIFFALLEECWDSSDSYSLSINVKNECVNARGLYWKTERTLKKLETSQNTRFLCMSVLEGAYHDAMQILTVHLNAFLSGQIHPDEKIQALTEIFTDNPWKKLWETQAPSYGKILSAIGLPLRTTDYQELYLITDALSDALLFYDHAEMYQMTDGTPAAKEAVPHICTSITKYTSEADFLWDLYRQMPSEPKIIAFGAVEATVDHDKNLAFYRDMHGYDTELLRNLERNTKKTREEAKEVVIRKQIYLGVKNGGICYLIPMPVYDSHQKLSEETEYVYGRRRSYAPYQVFYRSIPQKEADACLLPAVRENYQLSDILDEEQKVWFPVFINETVRTFFKNRPDALRGIVSNGAVTDEKYAKYPAPLSVPFARPDIKESMRIPEARVLFQFFDIDETTIYDRLDHYLPLHTSGVISDTDVRERLSRMTEELCMDEIAHQLQIWIETHGKTWRRQIIDLVQEHQDSICSRAKTNAFSSFGALIDRIPSTLTYISRPIREADGVQRPNVYRTDVCSPIVLWSGNTIRKPKYIYRILPKTPDDFTDLFDMPAKDLPIPLILQKTIQTFCLFYQDHRYLRDRHPFPDQILIHICMGEKERKSWTMEVRPDDHTRESQKEQQTQNIPFIDFP